MNKPQLSNCCSAEIKPHIADEGTGCNVCSECGKACDIKAQDKTFEECCQEVARKHKLGTTLVMGHKKSYYAEAVEIYSKQLLANKEEVLFDFAKHLRVKLGMYYMYTREDFLKFTKEYLSESKEHLKP